MRNDKLSPSIIFILVLLIVLTVLNSYLLLKINKMIRSDSLNNDHYELALISAKEVNIENNNGLVLDPIGDLENYKIEIEDGKAYLTVLNKKGCERKYLNYSKPVVRKDNEKEEIQGFHTGIVNAYVDNTTNHEIYFLMKDGTIEYSVLTDMLSYDELKTSGKVGDISNAVSIVKGKNNSEEVPLVLTLDKGYINLRAITIN